MLLLEPLSLNGLFSLLTGEFPSQNYDTCATQFYSPCRLFLICFSNVLPGVNNFSLLKPFPKFTGVGLPILFDASAMSILCFLVFLYLMFLIYCACQGTQGNNVNF